MNTKKYMLMVVLGTRPEIIRLSEVLKLAKKYFDLVLVHTGQNYAPALSQVFFDDFALDAPDFYLDAAGANLGETVGNVISKTYALIEKEKPDALLVLGDTNSCLAAYSAKRLKVPIFHMEAGNRCFDMDVPEETNRRIIDHISDINLCYTENARLYLLEEGLGKDAVYVTGSPLAEVFAKNIAKVDASDAPEKLGIEKGKYFVVSMHREENVDEPARLHSLVDALNAAAETYKMSLIFSTHPRTKKRLEAEKIKLNPLVKSIEPLGFFDYNKLQKEAFCVLSDSGTLAEESAILGFPAVSIRTSTERPEGLDAGVFLLGGRGSKGILNAIEIAVDTFSKGRENKVRDYSDENVAEKVVKIIAGYLASK